MQRRTERDLTLVFRRWMSRNVRSITTIVVAFLLFNLVYYLSTKYGLNPFKTTFTTEIMTTTTTTTTTDSTSREPEIEEPSGKLLF